MKDLIVVEFAGDGMKQTTLHDFPTGGGCYVHDGVLHYSVGVQDSADFPADWRWEQDRFVRLPKERALQQRDTYRYWSDLHRATGWQEKQFWQEGEEVRAEVGGADLAVRLEGTASGARLVARHGRRPEITIVTLDDEFRRIDAATYGDLPAVSHSRRLTGPWVGHTPGASRTTE